MGEDLDSSEPKIFLVISHHLTSVFKTVIRFQFFLLISLKLAVSWLLLLFFPVLHLSLTLS